jgi:diguanylate cyclase (GGDEF)-like protein
MERAMVGIRRGVVVLGLTVAAALIGGLAWNLLNTQDHGRRTLRDSFDRRAALTAKLIGSAFLATNTAENARQAFGGPARSLPEAVRKRAAASAGRVMVLDARGRVLAAAPPELARDRSLLARNRHLRVALGGSTALSDAFRDPAGRWVIGIAVPFEAPSGRRVLAGSGPVEIVRNFTDGFFASASAMPGAQRYLLDGRGRTLSAMTTAGQETATPGPALSAALARAPHGHYGDRTYVSAPVPASRWRVVLTVPTAALYASIDGGPSRAAWQLFIAFSAAVCALLALGVAAARSARRLAAATERENAAQKLAEARLHDSLTALPNRTLFEDRATQAISGARRRDRAVAVLFIDVDYFKRVNDSLGHAAGDAVLREVADRLRRGMRDSDSVSRFGGDEFVVLCADLEADEALRVAHAVERALAGPVAIGGRQVPVTFSIGVAVHRPGDEVRTAGDLVREADVAMYRAKELGRDRVEIFDSALHHQALARLDAEAALRRAIDEEQFVVFYQPIVALPGGQLRGAEALVRWRRPETGELVPPAEFIPLAEETGLVGEIDGWVLRTAVAEVGEWSRRGLVDSHFVLSVNVSARQLADPRLPDAVADALTTWDRSAGRLCLEITESAMMPDPAGAKRTLDRLAALGVMLAIDDFGVGHSSLGQLARSLPICLLKLDRSFVHAMTAPRDRGIVEAAAALARALSLATVAEGVESADQAADLAAMGFTYAQGFHYGRPAHGAEFIAQLRRVLAA